MHLMNEIIIKPFKSIGEYHLNISREDVESKFGEAPKTVVDNIVENLTEYREALELTYIKSRGLYKLESVTCTKHTTPIINGINIFEAGLDALKQVDNDFIEGPQYTDRRFNRMRPSIAPRKRHQAG